MMMGMSMSMQMLCTVCQQPITGPDADQNAVHVALVGACHKNSSACCKCHQPVGVESQTSAYKRRWRDYMKLFAARRLREIADAGTDMTSLHLEELRTIANFLDGGSQL
tara:strand:+ start:157305 stop:157631 length:327 start_codon:yes stop_codon:yes gene_type:complete